MNGTDSDSTLSCEVRDFRCCFRVPLGTVDGSETNVSLPVDTALADFTRILVYARSQLAEQSTPESASVSNIAFLDLDFDASSEAYLVYLSDGQSLSQVGSAIPAGTNLLSVPDNTQSSAFVSFLVFTRSTLAEQTTPVSLSFSDMVVSLGNLSFTDLDLDAADLGGPLTWEEPSDSAYVTHYEVYIARDLRRAAVQ